MVYKYSAHCLSLDFGSECLQRRKNSLSLFVLDSKTKEDDNRFAKCALRNQLRATSSYYNQEKWLKDDTASEKPIETTAESSFTSFLVARVSFSGRKAAKLGRKLRSEVPRHIKVRRRIFLKLVYCCEREASRKLQEAVCC